MKVIAPRKNHLKDTKNKTRCEIELSEQLTEMNFITGKTHFIGLAVFPEDGRFRAETCSSDNVNKVVLIIYVCTSRSLFEIVILVR